MYVHYYETIEELLQAYPHIPRRLLNRMRRGTGTMDIRYGKFLLHLHWYPEGFETEEAPLPSNWEPTN